MEKAMGRGSAGLKDKPYDDLFIYLLEGILDREDEKKLGENFLGNWVEGEQSFLFFSSPSGHLISSFLEYRQNLKLVDQFRFTYEEWLGGLPALIEIDNFSIVSPWSDLDAPEQGIIIRLDPGVVFGNGLHPTTRDCLKSLTLAQNQQPFNRVLDLGTGTGILSIAAALLGAEKVMAADLNPLCVRTTLRNVELNRLDHIIQVKEARAEDLAHEPADLVMANIHQAVIQSLLDLRPFNPGERLIISGLMRSQFREILAQMKAKGFKVIKTWDHEMIWFTLLAIKDGK